MRAVIILILATLPLLPARQLMGGTPQPLVIPGRDAALRTLVFEPADDGPKHPAVIALHGCAGLYMRDGSLNPRQRDWGMRLSAAGFVVIMPDSLGSRGLGANCHDRDAVSAGQRLDDADNARVYLLSRPDVKADAISLLGWSSGGSAVLQAVGAAGATDLAPSQHHFSRAVALYPDCRAALKSGTWQARIPLMILIGESDDWTPASSCQRLARAGAAAPLVIKVYPGAVHDFDQPGLERQDRDDAGATADGAGEASVGTNQNAREDALALVPSYLTR